MRKQKTTVDLAGSRHEHSFMLGLVEAGVRGQVIHQKLDAERRAKEELDKQRKEDNRQLKQSGKNGKRLIFLPQYKFDERLKIDREVDPPPASLFIGLGYNETKSSGKRHYRRYYPDELENVPQIFPRKPFHEEKVHRAQTRAFGSLFGGGNEVLSVKEVGNFKGLAKVFNQGDLAIHKLKIKE